MNKEQQKAAKGMPRRDFLKVSALGAAAAITAPSILASCGGGGSAGLVPLKQPGEYYIPDLPDKAPDGRLLRAGLVGCGDRGTGAATNFLAAADGVEIVALGDVFEDKVERARTRLQDDFGQTIPAENCFVGLDAYQKVIDSGVDVVLLCEPPGFRPQHFKYAVEKGVHSFIEKPVAVDAEGYRSIIATARQAAAKNLSVVAGTQNHHYRIYLASYQKIMEGMIGEIRGGTVYYNTRQSWHRSRQPGWNDMEWMLRDWMNWRWLSGDHIIEQHIHNIDVFTWFSGLKPLKATAVGSRQRRMTGDCYDNFSVDFEFPGGVHLHSMCRQIDGCSNYMGEIIQGTRGVWYGGFNLDHYITDLEGNEVWRFDKAASEAEYAQHDPYVLEHIDLIRSIREGKPVNEAEDCAISTLTGIMGREAAYTGQTITWDEISAATLGLFPENPQFGSVDMSKYKVPVPGTDR